MPPAAPLPAPKPGRFASEPMRATEDRHSGVPAGLTLVFVSLYLILLAFFLVLNAISQFELTRSTRAMKSVDQVFARPIPAPPGSSPGVEGRAADPDFFADLARLLSGVLEPGDRLRGPSDDTLAVSARLDLLFPPGRATVRPEREAFLRELAAIGQAAPEGRVRLATLFVGLSRADAADPDTLSVARLRAGSLGRKLGEAGYPAEALAVGLAPDRPGRLVMIFQTGPQ